MFSLLHLCLMVAALVRTIEETMNSSVLEVQVAVIATIGQDNLEALKADYMQGSKFLRCQLSSVYLSQWIAGVFFLSFLQKNFSCQLV